MTFTEKEARFYACELIVVLEFIHKNGYIYRDLKPENVLIDEEGHIKLTDFGLASKFTTCLRKTFCGTDEYMAPEIWKRDCYDFMIDWWALGILMYDLVSGHPPFIKGQSKDRFAMNIMTQSLPS